MTAGRTGHAARPGSSQRVQVATNGKSRSRAPHNARRFTTAVALFLIVPTALFTTWLAVEADQVGEEGQFMVAVMAEFLVGMLVGALLLVSPLVVGLVVWLVMRRRDSRTGRTAGHAGQWIRVPGQAPAAEHAPTPAGLVVIWRILVAFAAVVLFLAVVFSASLALFWAAGANASSAAEGATDWSALIGTFSVVPLVVLGPIYIVAYLALSVVTFVHARRVPYSKEGHGHGRVA